MTAILGKSTNALGNNFRFMMTNSGEKSFPPMVTVNPVTISALEKEVLDLLTQAGTDNIENFDISIGLVEIYKNNLTRSSTESVSKSTLINKMEGLAAVTNSVQTSSDITAVLRNQQSQATSISRYLDEIKREIKAMPIKEDYSMNQVIEAIQKAITPTEENAKEGISLYTSHKELADIIVRGIQNIRNDYVDFYYDLMHKYMKMYEAYNRCVQGAAAKAVSNGDGNNVSFDNEKMQAGYDKFREEVNGIELGIIKNWTDMSPAERQSMKTTLEPTFKITGDGKIEFNLDQYNDSLSFPSGLKEGKVSTASYQAWLASFNTISSALQSNMQSFAQRNNQATSIYDSLNKVLVETISKLAELEKDVFRSL